MVCEKEEREEAVSLIGAFFREGNHLRQFGLFIVVVVVVEEVLSWMGSFEDDECLACGKVVLSL